jgi:ATP-dependent DNA helicase UvrD/PcrA
LTTRLVRATHREHMFVQGGVLPADLLADLNEEQRAAVTHKDGPLLVLAGAGTGKTTTLVSRLAWLVSEGVPPERILLLTFTRRAAREMLARTQSLLGSSGSGQIVGGTFHSVAYRLIATHAAALGLPARFGVLDASDAADLVIEERELRMKPKPTVVVYLHRSSLRGTS